MKLPHLLVHYCQQLIHYENKKFCSLQKCKICRTCRISKVFLKQAIKKKHSFFQPTKKEKEKRDLTFEDGICLSGFSLHILVG